MHILLHEIEHVKQAEKSPKAFLLSMLNDKASRKLEKQADKAANLKEEKREYALESILYCYEIGGWEKATKMAEFLFNHDKLYGGGYEKELSKKLTIKIMKYIVESFTNKTSVVYKVTTKDKLKNSLKAPNKSFH